MNRSSVPGAVGLAVLVAVGGSGCGTAIAYAWPKTHKHQTITTSKRVRVRGNLPGATVVTADGKVLGPAPYDDDASYQIDRTWQEHRYVGAILGSVIALTTFTVGVVGWATHTDNPVPWLVVAGIGFEDTWGAGMAIAKFQQQNWAARYTPNDRMISVDHSYQLSWPGFDPVMVTASVPGTREVVAPRPTRVSFSQALLYWESHAAIEPHGEALFELGVAHMAWAERGVAGAAATARGYLERYLAAGVPTHATEARQLLVRAREITR